MFSFVNVLTPTTASHRWSIHSSPYGLDNIDWSLYNEFYETPITTTNAHIFHTVSTYDDDPRFQCASHTFRLPYIISECDGRFDRRNGPVPSTRAPFIFNEFHGIS